MGPAQPRAPWRRTLCAALALAGVLAALAVVGLLGMQAPVHQPCPACPTCPEIREQEALPVESPPPPSPAPPAPAQRTPPPFAGLCEEAIPGVQESLSSVDLIRDNLWPDLEAWDGQGLYTVDDVRTTSSNLRHSRDIHFLVEIRNNTMRLADRKWECRGEDAERCNPLFLNIQEFLEAGMASGRLHLPDSLFMLNVADDSICVPQEDSPCKAPVLGVNRRDGHLEVLVPIFWPDFQVHSKPWTLKKPMAFFRGTPFCNDVLHYVGDRQVNCSRLLLSEMTREHPDLLNVTLTEDFEDNGRLWKGTPGEHTPVEEWPSFQMLLNLDGYAASSRLGLLLATNSLTLKQHSVYKEYYYRSVLPCVHYLPFWERDEEDVLDVIRAAAADPQWAEAVAANAQAFALLHLNDDAKFRYWEEAVRGYNTLIKPIVAAGSDEARRRRRRHPDARISL